MSVIDLAGMLCETIIFGYDGSDARRCQSGVAAVTERAGAGLGKDLILSELYTRVDDFSFQIMAKGSARFFVRVTSPKSSKTPIIFSDFILNPDDGDRAIEALHLLKGQGFPLAPAMKLVFQDIHPSYSDERDRPELVRRHDQIVAVVKDYAAQSGLSVENTLLDPKAGKFETVVLFE